MDNGGLPALELECRFSNDVVTISSVPIKEPTTTKEIDKSIKFISNILKKQPIESLDDLDDILLKKIDLKEPNQKMIALGVSINWLKALADQDKIPVYKYIASLIGNRNIIVPRLIKHINVRNRKILIANRGDINVRKIINEWDRVDRAYNNIIHNAWDQESTEHKIISEIQSRPCLKIGLEGNIDTLSKSLIDVSSILSNIAPNNDWKTLSEIKKLYGNKKIIAADYTGHKSEHVFTNAGIFNPYLFTSVNKLVDSVSRAHRLGQKVIIRPGSRQTEDPITVDIAMGLGAEYFDLKNDRIYYPLVNKLIRIEEDIAHG